MSSDAVLVLTGLTTTTDVERHLYRPSQIVDSIEELLSELSRNGDAQQGSSDRHRPPISLLHVAHERSGSLTTAACAADGLHCLFNPSFWRLGIGASSTSMVVLPP